MRINYFLFIHHIIFCTFVVLAFQSQSLFMLKVDIIVSCFATYEFLLYAALIARKTPLFQSWFKWLMISGLSFYFFTRVVQIILLLALFVLGFGPMSHTSKDSALYWVGLCMCIALMALQMYTFVIYKAIWDHTLQTLPVTNKQVVERASSSARYAKTSRIFWAWCLLNCLVHAEEAQPVACCEGNCTVNFQPQPGSDTTVYLNVTLTHVHCIG